MSISELAQNLAESAKKVTYEEHEGMVFVYADGFDLREHRPSAHHDDMDAIHEDALEENLPTSPDHGEHFDTVESLLKSRANAMRRVTKGQRKSRGTKKKPVDKPGPV